jgi:hypothetical protein
MATVEATLKAFALDHAPARMQAEETRMAAWQAATSSPQPQPLDSYGTMPYARFRR